MKKQEEDKIKQFSEVKIIKIDNKTKKQYEDAINKKVIEDSLYKENKEEDIED